MREINRDERLVMINRNERQIEMRDKNNDEMNKDE